ncbi:MAG TPA: NADH-quinone oxidoreductase subunit K [Firmicutes bacterium]|nr:NADH-quinone oxidoreductase subunit K [Bacillota bacterium]
MFNEMNVLMLGILGLFAVGLYALLAVRNLIKIVVALQILVKGAIMAFILAGKINGHMQTAQSVALTVIVADTMVAVIGLALAVQVKRRLGTLDVNELTSLRG